MTRTVALILAASVATVACTSADGSLSVGSAPTTTGTDESIIPPPTTEPAGSTSTTEPGRPPVTTVDPIDGGGGALSVKRLNVDDALLREGDVGGDWEFQRRSLERIGYDIGENQTDCESYWEFERLAELDGGTAGWWQPGAELSHDVYTTGGESVDGLAALLVELVVGGCPVVNWLEGGTFTVDRAVVSVDGASALQFRSDVGETTTVVVLTRGDLISVVRVHRWPVQQGGDGMTEFTPDELQVVVQLAADRLAAARLKAPTNDPPPIVEPPETTLATLPPVTTRVPIPTTTIEAIPVDDESAARRDALLTPADLGVSWTADGPERFVAGVAEDDPCPGLVAVDEISAVLDWTIELRNDDGVTANQAIGVTADAATAAGLADDFATIDECDLSDDGFDPGSGTSGSIDVPGADAASRLEWSIADGGLEIVIELAVIAVDDHVMILGVTHDDTSELPDGLLATMSELAVTRLLRQFASLDQNG